MKRGDMPFDFTLKAVAAATGMLLFVANSHGFELETGNEDVGVRFDTTLKYSGAVRVASPNPLFVDPAAGGNMINSDDGDQSFKRGSMISNRVDFLSELDVDYKKKYGFRISGAGWYDAVYNRNNSNNSPGTVNAMSVPYDEFTDATRKLHGRDAEILDAFVWGNFEFDDVRAQAKLGRHALLWGESLFYANNAIAGGMAPLDVVKLASVPSTPAKEFVLPVGQLSGQVQLSPDLSLAGYYQYEWRRTRLPGAGSYFSQGDMLDDGGERIFVGPGAYVARGKDVTAKDSGQYGLALKTRAGEADLGFYAIRYHAKVPQIGFNFIPSATPDQGGYALVFPENVRAFGASVNQTIGSVNLAGEVSIRHNAPLTSLPSVSFGGAPAISNSGSPLYAVGKTAHVNVNAIASLGPSFIASSAILMGEVAWNRMLSCKLNCGPAALDPGVTRDALSFRATYSPSYYNVLNGLDLNPLISVSYNPKGKGAAGAMGPHKGGDVTIGVDATYMSVWKAGLSFTHYYGPADNIFNTANTYSFKQTLRDRDFVSFTLSRTF
jgi:hypothetical protein